MRAATNMRLPAVSERVKKIGRAVQHVYSRYAHLVYGLVDRTGERLQ